MVGKNLENTVLFFFLTHVVLEPPDGNVVDQRLEPPGAVEVWKGKDVLKTVLECVSVWISNWKTRCSAKSNNDLKVDTFPSKVHSEAARRYKAASMGLDQFNLTSHIVCEQKDVFRVKVYLMTPDKKTKPNETSETSQNKPSRVSYHHPPPFNSFL